jgi:hypothetical protein
MKNLKVLFFLTLTFCLVSCKQKIKEPKDIGKAVFDILQKDITSMSKEEYSEYLLSKDEVKSFGVNSEEYVNNISDNYNKFIEKSKRENIAWSKVQYLDFEYKIKSGGPSEVIRGIVSYKYNDKTYKAKVFAIWIEEEYRFIEISGPY